MDATWIGGLLRAAVAAAAVFVAPAPVSAAVARPSATAPPVPNASVVWLCRPGMRRDPCTVDPSATSIGPDGKPVRRPAHDAAHPAFDCFYVYPTVVPGPALNAPLRVQPVLRDVAVEQASRFSQVCDVWAPVYRQVTTAGLLPSLASGASTWRIAYDGIRTAFDTFLADHRAGRPIVFIGHSQGAAILIDLLQQEVDPNPRLRGRLLSAILLGGNVQVPDGKVVGATFKHLPLCLHPAQHGCVIAYSSFDQMPPSNSLFGIPGRGVSLLSRQRSSAGQQVACVNPARIDSTVAAPLEPYFASPNPSATSAAWVTYPKLYTARCEHRDGITWLQVDDLAAPGDTRPVVAPNQGPAWGLHVDDLNLALGNLVSDVAQQELADDAG
jgi:Protein of unknown function (DUF3089)